MLRERRFQTGIVEINYTEGPSNGPPLVVLHGGAARWQGGETLLRQLAERWRVFGPDFRGHGRSGRVQGRYRLRDYVQDTAAFLREIVREPSVLYGHSLGGEVAVMAAAEHPGLVRALIVGDAPLSIEVHPTEEANHRAMNVLWHRLAGRPVGEIVPALKAMPIPVPGAAPPVPAREVMGEESPWFAYQATNLHLLDPGMLGAVLEGPDVMLAGYDPEILLPKIACPVLLLQADPARGGLLRDEEVARGLRLLPRGSHVRLTGIGHELHGPPSQVPAVLEAITPFLDSVRNVEA